MTIAALICCWFARPQRLVAPLGWYVDGVDPAGWCDFRPVLGRAADDLSDAVHRVEIRDDRALLGRVHCTGGATARQDGRSVWCQR